MSYEKQTWVTGDVVTANKLNHMEDGIAEGGGTGGGDVLCVTFSESGGTWSADKTYAEIAAAVKAKKWVFGQKIVEDGEYTDTNVIPFNSLGEAEGEDSSAIFLLGDPETSTNMFFIISSDGTVTVEPVTTD